MKNLYKKLTFILFISLLFSSLVSAQQNVYAPPPPADSAFVRVIHASMEAGSLSAEIGEVAFGALEYGQIGAYTVVPAGSYETSLAGLSSTIEVAAGNYYTVAVADEMVLLQDPVNNNLAKTMLVLYNFSASESTDMKTADGSMPVIEAVAMNSMDEILVNPIAVDLGAFAGSTLIDSFTGLSLVAGATYSLVVMGPADHLSASWTLNEVIQ